MSNNCLEHRAKAVTDDDTETEALSCPARAREDVGIINIINITHYPLLQSTPTPSTPESGEARAASSIEQFGTKQSALRTVQ